MKVRPGRLFYLHEHATSTVKKSSRGKAVPGVKFCYKEISPILNLLPVDPLNYFPKCEKDHVRDKARFPAFPVLGQNLTSYFFKSASHQYRVEISCGKIVSKHLFEILFRNVVSKFRVENRIRTSQIELDKRLQSHKQSCPH